MTESVQTAKVPLTSPKGADRSPSEEALIRKKEHGAFHLSLWFWIEVRMLNQRAVASTGTRTLLFVIRQQDTVVLDAALPEPWRLQDLLH